jgi:hypothetical protein
MKTLQKLVLAFAMVALLAAGLSACSVREPGPNPQLEPHGLDRQQ